MNPFVVIPELRIGSIIEVSGPAIRIELDGAITELTRTHDGRVYPIGQFASVIKIHYGRLLLFAYVRLLRMRSEMEREEGWQGLAPSDDSRVIDADLFAEGLLHEPSGRLELSRGVRHYPLPGQGVYLTTQQELRLVYERAEADRTDGCNPMIPIGDYVGADGTTCFANMDKLFGLHCAVLGSTGSGKSGTVAAVVHSILDCKSDDTSAPRFRPRIIVIDPHGEYAKAFSERCVVYRAYNVVAGDKGPAKQLRLPYWTMAGEEFRDLVIGKTEWEATSEHNIVYKALVHARLAQRGLIEKSQSWQGKGAGTVSDPAHFEPLQGAGVVIGLHLVRFAVTDAELEGARGMTFHGGYSAFSRITSSIPNMYDGTAFSFLPTISTPSTCSPPASSTMPSGIGSVRITVGL